VGCDCGFWSNLWQFLKNSIKMIEFKEKQFLVLGTSTDIGKTFFICEIVKKLLEKKIAINAIKPIISGFDMDDKESDSAKILEVLSLDLNKKNIEATTPFRFKTPLSPPVAARLEGKTINYTAVKNFCKKKIQKARYNKETLLIESAGGVMTPINDDKTFLDLAEDLKIPVILIGACYLGAVNHSLCALEALKSRDIKVSVLIVNDHMNCNNPWLKMDDLVDEIKNFTKIPVFSIDNFFNNLIL